MNLNTLYQTCVYFCICMTIFTVSLSFVNGLGVFDVSVEGGFIPGSSSEETFKDLTNISDEQGESGGMDVLWAGILTASGLGGLFVAWITRSTTILGVYVFSAVFWVSYINSMSILNIGGYLPLGFIAIGTTAMLFIWAGAIAGMLSGSG